MHDPRPSFNHGEPSSQTPQGQAQESDGQFDAFDQIPQDNISLENKIPDALNQLIYTIVWIFQTYGWVILIGTLIIIYLVQNVLKPRWYRWRKRYLEQREMENIDPATVYRQQQTMDMARKRMQEKYDSQAARYQEKQQELEMQKRREKIEDWEKHLQGGGYRSKIKRPEENYEQQKFIKPKKKLSKPLRPNNYNPLTGTNSGGGSSYKPSQRGGSGGGG